MRRGARLAANRATRNRHPAARSKEASQSVKSVSVRSELRGAALDHLLVTAYYSLTTLCVLLPAYYSLTSYCLLLAYLPLEWREGRPVELA